VIQPPPAGSPGAQLAVACSSRRLTLINVLPQGGKVALLGAADATLVGRPVTIRFDGKRTVATAIVGPDGFFTATAPMPPKAIRNTGHARYMAVSGDQSSLNLKLMRRVVMQRPTAAGGRVTLTGRIVPPLTRPVSPIVVKVQTDCRRTTTAATVKPKPSGAFTVSIPAPAGAGAAIYRVATSVRKTPGNPKRFPTFSLPLPVTLG
jgi:hypothetical protein